MNTSIADFEKAERELSPIDGNHKSFICPTCGGERRHIMSWQHQMNWGSNRRPVNTHESERVQKALDGLTDVSGSTKSKISDLFRPFAQPLHLAKASVARMHESGDISYTAYIAVIRAAS